VPEAVFDAVVDLVPREDRNVDGQVFAGCGADTFRTAVTRACRAAADRGELDYPAVVGEPTIRLHSHGKNTCFAGVSGSRLGLAGALGYTDSA
jgi:hypothetical protein